MGNAGMVRIILGIGLLLIKKYRWVGLTVVLALTISLVFGEGILKPLIARLRPCVLYPWIPVIVATSLLTDYSFPSGHTFASFAAAIGVFCQSKRLGASALLLATGIGFSRGYLFVHYPSDVLAGGGILSGIIAYNTNLYLSISRPWLRNKIFREFSTFVHKN